MENANVLFLPLKKSVTDFIMSVSVLGMEKAKRHDREIGKNQRNGNNMEWMEWKHRTKEQQSPLGSIQEDAERGKKERSKK